MLNMKNDLLLELDVADELNRELHGEAVGIGIEVAPRYRQARRPHRQRRRQVACRARGTASEGRRCSDPGY
jgi:hypothetical protein